MKKGLSFYRVTTIRIPNATFTLFKYNLSYDVTHILDIKYTKSFACNDFVKTENDNTMNFILKSYSRNRQYFSLYAERN